MGGFPQSPNKLGANLLVNQMCEPFLVANKSLCSAQWAASLRMLSEGGRTQFRVAKVREGGERNGETKRGKDGSEAVRKGK